MKIYLVLFLGFASSVLSFNLGDSTQEGVTFEVTSTAVKVTVDESNTPGDRVKFVKVTDAEGPIDASAASLSDLLDIKVENGADATEFFVSTNRVDFEALVKEDLPINVIVDVKEIANTSNSHTVSLFVNNVDDESPVFFGPICTFKEETVIDITNSTCVYQVSDPDGFLGEMDFAEITGSRGESDLFEFQYKEPPADTVYEAEVYLVLKEGKKLDYETSTLYNFREDAKDTAGHATTPLASVPVIVEVEDIPDQPPQWVSFHASVAIHDETQPTEIQVVAIDGDYEINNPIIYGVIDDSGYVHIDGKTGLITVDPIPKEAELEQIQFYVIALEEGDPNSNVVDQITLLILY